MTEQITDERIAELRAEARNVSDQKLPGWWIALGSLELNDALVAERAELKRMADSAKHVLSEAGRKALCDTMDQRDKALEQLQKKRIKAWRKSKVDDLTKIIADTTKERDEALGEVRRLREQLLFSVPEKAKAACESCGRDFSIDARAFHNMMKAGEDVLCGECNE